MQISITGTGGVGGYFGGLLAKAKNDVTFVARGEHYQAIKQGGLTISSAKGEFKIANPQVVDSIRKLQEPELVLVFLKTFSTVEAISELAEVVSPKTVVITFQTGLENDLEIKKLLPSAAVFPGLAYINSRISAPGKVEQISGACKLIFGARRGQDASVLNRIEELFTTAGISAQLVDNIELEIWKKLVWISAFSGATVLCRAKIGEILNEAAGERLFRSLLNEALRVAEVSQIELSEADRREMLERIEYYKGEGRNAKTSLLLDIEAGRRTEVETIHGALIRQGQSRGLSTPLLDAVYAAVKVYERAI